MPRPRRRIACACGSTARINTYVSIDGSERSSQLECRSCGSLTSQHPSGHEHLVEAEWARINAQGPQEMALILERLRGREVVVHWVGAVAGSLPGTLDLVAADDQYEVQHGQAVARFRPGAISRVDGQRLFVRGRLKK